MWIASRHGFYSVVFKADESTSGKEVIHIRARVKKDLLNLSELCKQHAISLGGYNRVQRSYAGGDYPWRMIVPKREFFNVMSVLASDLDYPNFKSEVAKQPDQREKLNAYHYLWHSMFLIRDRHDESEAATRRIKNKVKKRHASRS